MKRKFLRVLSSVFSRFKDEPNETEVNVKKLILRILNLEDRTIMFVPISEHIIIDSEKVKILLTSERINISNHTQFYEFNLDQKFARELSLIIKSSVNRERLKIEKSMFENKNELLKKLIETI